MLEFIRQYREMLVTGEWTHFMYYVIFAWVIWLPRPLGAGIFRSFRPAQPLRLTTRYILAVLIAVALFTIPTYYMALGAISEWYAFTAACIAILFISPPLRRRLVRWAFAWTFYGKHVKLVDQTGPVGEHDMIALMTIFDEDPKFLNKSLRLIKRCLELAPGNYVLMAIIDGYGRFAHADAAIPVAKKYCDIVMTSTAQKKRSNLDAMVIEAYQRNLVKTGDEIFHLIDSDITPADDQVAIELNRPFADPAIGGVTTAQYVEKPKTFAQHVMAIFETIRNWGSQLLLALQGSIICLPGRWFAILAKYLTPEVSHDLANDSFSWFGLARRYCKAGDDRFLTEAILKAGGKTIMALDAIVFTITPESFRNMILMVTRWARSSNGYTLRAGWMFKPQHWTGLWVNWGNIFLALFTCYIIYWYWPYNILYGDTEIVLWEATLFAVLSMAMTMTVRFVPVWSSQLFYLLYMFVMGFMGMLMQTIQVYGIATHVHKIGSWGTRGADAGAADVREQFEVIYEDSRIAHVFDKSF